MDPVAAAGTDFEVPLGDFQRLMLYWNEQVPFHVVDLLELKAPVEVTALRRAANEVLLATGIAAPSVEVAAGICTYRARPCDVEVASISPRAGVPLRQVLAEHTTAELRRPFQLNVEPLIRLWTLQHEASTFVGMTWQHWMGDGMAAGDLLRRIVARLRGWTLAPATTLHDWTATDPRFVFAPWFTWRRKLRHLWETIRTVGTSSLVAQLQRPRGVLPESTVHFLDLPEDALERIRRAGRPAQATVNDVFAAVTAHAVAAVMPRSSRWWWQRHLRVGNIVDLRPSGGAALQGKGGLFLGLYNIDCPPNPPANWEDLFAQVRRRSRRAKQYRTYFASLGGFRFSRKLWPWVPVKWRRPIYTNILRLTAVLTNLRYPDTWYAGDCSGQVGAYWRAVPMGFMYPLVLAITTLGQRLTVTMSCDATGPIAEKAGAIKQEIEQAIAAW